MFTDWKGNSYDSILGILDWLIKIAYYKLIKIFINTLDLSEVIIDIIV